MNNIESSTTPVNEQCLTLCPVIAQENIRKQDVLRKAQQLSSSVFTAGAREKYIDESIERVRRSSEYATDYSPEQDMPVELSDRIQKSAGRYFDEEAALAGPRMAQYEEEITAIDERISGFAANCHGILRTVVESQSTDQQIEITVCDSPRAAQLSDGEEVYRTIADIIREA